MLIKSYKNNKKELSFRDSRVSITIDRRKARVVPESKYSIGGIKNGISILFFYNERGYDNAKH